MTTETNMPTQGALREAADKLLNAAMEYHRVYSRTLGSNGVVWVKGSDGSLVVLTRGEYLGTLMHNIDRVQRGYEFATETAL